MQFGVEVVSGADSPHVAGALAALAEELGYDAVIFADRLEAGGADALTLAAWTAARTTLVQIVAGRLDATARPASVLARSAGSLQLLSGGRGGLMLGSGSATEDLDGVAEAFAVIRALQDTRPGRVSLAGTHHHLADAEPGPALGREVPLWLHGSSTAVAALAGRVADGWSVDLDEVGVGDMAALNAVVDGAAVEAGRDVREVRRSVMLDSTDVPDVSTLTALVVDMGVSSMVIRVGSQAKYEDEATLRAFIRDIAPPVREGAALALPPGSLS